MLLLLSRTTSEKLAARDSVGVSGGIVKEPWGCCL